MPDRSSPRVAIIYSSGAGTTVSLAEGVAVGAAEFATVEMLRITSKDIIAGRFENTEILQAADAADAIALGSPTNMGGPAAEFKASADATSGRWARQVWADKIAAGFTIGGCPNGDQGSTLAYLAVFAAQHSMLWCGLNIPGHGDPLGRNRLGTQLGVAALENDGAIDEIDRVTARHLGRRLAQQARRSQT